MPKLVQLTSTVNTTPDSNHVILFYAEEDGVLKLKAKKSDGSVVDMLHELADINNSDENMSINWNFKFVNTLDEPIRLSTFMPVDIPEEYNSIMFDANEEVICYYYPELPAIITIQDEGFAVNEYFETDASGNEGWLGYGNHRAFLLMRGEFLQCEDSYGQLIDDCYVVSYNVYSPTLAFTHWDYFDMTQTDPRTGLDIENNEDTMFGYANVTAIPIDE